MKKNNYLIRGRVVIAVIFLLFNCNDFLELDPYGTTTFQTLSEQTNGAEALLIAAYSNLDGFSGQGYATLTSASNWTFGSIAGGDAYKGAFEDKQPYISQIEIHHSLSADNPLLEAKWVTYYHGIARANDAIKAFTTLKNVKEKFRRMRIGEARFLRGFYHFELWKIFRHIPIIDETVEDVRVGNREDPWDILHKIQQDLLYASNHLPKTQEQQGRITKGAAQSYFGISKMWEKDWSTAKIYFDSVIGLGRYQLNDEYHQNFNAEFRSGTKYTNVESILEVQQTVNDGADGLNGNTGDIETFINGGPGGCCGHHSPSQNLVNAFKTDAAGLPMLEDFNNSDVTNDDGITSDDVFIPYSGTLDPRLDWTVGRRGIPYLDWGKHPGKDWILDQVYAGPYSPKKNMFYKSQQSDYTESTWGLGGFNANNFKLLRYADVLLYAAEAAIELDDLARANDLVNMVRARAANSSGFVKNNGVNAANYLINLYPAFPDQTYARKAVQFERRLELAMEGHRFFDLVRWGVAAEEKYKYFEKEKEKRTYLSAGNFEKDKHEMFPIPEKAIYLSLKDGMATIEQNDGYH